MLLGTRQRSSRSLEKLPGLEPTAWGKCWKIQYGTNSFPHFSSELRRLRQVSHAPTVRWEHWRESSAAGLVESRRIFGWRREAKLLPTVRWEHWSESSAAGLVESRRIFGWGGEAKLLN